MLRSSAFPTPEDLCRVLPEIAWCGFGLLGLLLQPFVKSRHFFTFVGLVGALAGTVLSVIAGLYPGAGYHGLIQSDAVSVFFHLLVGTVSSLVVLAADPYLERENLAPAEFYALVLFATAG